MAKSDKKTTDKKTNSKKPEAPPVIDATTTETPSTEVPTEALAVAPESEPPTVIERLESMGIVVADDGEMCVMVARTAKKRGALTDLVDDSELTPEVREQVRVLVELANPAKPGMEEVSTTWAPPQVMIHQPTSNDPKKPESSKPGDLYSTSGQLLEVPFAFVPFYFHEEFVNFEQGQRNPVCQSPDGKVGGQFGICGDCPYLPFGKQRGGKGQQEKTDCNSQIVVALLSADMSQIYVSRFSKTSRSAGQALIALAKAHPAPWTQIYLLSTEKKTGDLGTYWIAKIEPTGRDNPPEVHKIARALQELYEAERKWGLGDFYKRIASAPLQAAQMEAAVSESALTAGLDEAEPDLSTPDNSSARTASKPM